MSSSLSETVPTQAYPSTEEVNRHRLLDACIEAVDEHGLSSLQMNHIIERSGLSRRTAYKYFSNKSDVVNEAYLREGAQLFDQIIEEVSQHTSVEDIFVYAFLLVYQHIPQNPLMRELIYNHQELLENLNVEQTVLETLKDFDLEILFKDNPDLCRDMPLLSAYWAHALLSFLLLRSGDNKSLEEVEAYVRKRFVPGLCLQQYKLKNG